MVNASHLGSAFAHVRDSNFDAKVVVEFEGRGVLRAVSVFYTSTSRCLVLVVDNFRLHHHDPAVILHLMRHMS